MTLSIAFPRFIVLRNTRLALIYYSIAIFAVVYVSTVFIYEQQFLTKRTPTGTVQFWVSNWSIESDETAKINAADDSKLICKEPEKYEYCYDERCEWSSQNMKCLNLCDVSHAADKRIEECIENPERWVKEDRGVFVPTFMMEHNVKYSRNKETKEIRRTSTSRNRVIKGIEDLSIGFDHQFAVYDPEEIRHGSSASNPESGLLTVLLTGDGSTANPYKEIRRWLPGTSIEIEMKTLLALLEVSGTFFDVVEPTLGRNFLENATFADGVLTRLSGVDLVIALSYHNPAVHYTRDWDGPVCYVKVQGKSAWTSKPQFSIVDHLGSYLLKYNHGIRIRFAVSGSFGYFDTMSLLSLFTSLAVFINLAKKVVFNFAIHCLGVLSRVFRGLTHYKASVVDECSQLALRLASHKSVFDKLQDKQMGISQARLMAIFLAIFKHRPELDEHEIEQFVEFVFHDIGAQGAEYIDLGAFMTKFSNGEDLDLDTLVHLFDIDRHKSYLEEFFAGPHLHVMLKKQGQARRLSSAVLSNKGISKELSPRLSSHDSLQRTTSNDVAFSGVDGTPKNNVTHTRLELRGKPENSSRRLSLGKTEKGKGKGKGLFTAEKQRTSERKDKDATVEASLSEQTQQQQTQQLSTLSHVEIGLEDSQIVSCRKTLEDLLPVVKESQKMIADLQVHQQELQDSITKVAYQVELLTPSKPIKHKSDAQTLKTIYDSLPRMQKQINEQHGEIENINRSTDKAFKSADQAVAGNMKLQNICRDLQSRLAAVEQMQNGSMNTIYGSLGATIGFSADPVKTEGFEAMPEVGPEIGPEEFGSSAISLPEQSRFHSQPTSRGPLVAPLPTAQANEVGACWGARSSTKRRHDCENVSELMHFCIESPSKSRSRQEDDLLRNDRPMPGLSIAQSPNVARQRLPCISQEEHDVLNVEGVVHEGKSPYR